VLCPLRGGTYGQHQRGAGLLLHHAAAGTPGPGRGRHLHSNPGVEGVPLRSHDDHRGPYRAADCGASRPLSQRSHSPGSRWPRLARILSGRWRPRRRNHTHRRRAPREVSFQPSGAPPRRRRRSAGQFLQRCGAGPWHRCQPASTGRSRPRRARYRRTPQGSRARG